MLEAFSIQMFPETLIPTVGFVIDSVIGATWNLFLSPVCLPTAWWQDIRDETNARKCHSRFCVRKHNAIISHARNASCSVWVGNFVTVRKERRFGSIRREWLNTAIENWTILLCIQISAWKPIITTEIVRGFPQSFQVRAGILIQSWSWPLISTSFAINCSLTILPPDPIHGVLQRASLNKLEVNEKRELTMWT